MNDWKTSAAIANNIGGFICLHVGSFVSSSPPYTQSGEQNKTLRLENCELYTKLKQCHTKVLVLQLGIGSKLSINFILNLQN